ncbi:MAG: signal peptidase I [Clostridia bacterium]|nr:signal peptidase I [Clostridia bacterium]
MNEDFIPSNPEEDDKTAPASNRRPIRRARRTVAPFSSHPKATDLPKAKQELTQEPTDPEAVPAAVEKLTPEDLSEEVTSPKGESSSCFETELQAEIPLEAKEAEDITTDSTEKAVAEDAITEFSETIAGGELEISSEEADSEKLEDEEAAEEPSADPFDETPEEESAEKLSPIAETFDWIKSFLFSLTAVIFVFTLIFRGVTVNGGSMLPTLENEEYLIISDLFYTPKTGDIVVVQSPHYKNATEPLIKRVIATGGQKVKINFSTWEVWVDGQLLHEDYILRDGGTSMNCEDLKPNENNEVEIQVEENCIFVMGDHRNDSLDSRSNSVGQIDERYIMGRVIIRLSPMQRFGKVA